MLGAGVGLLYFAGFTGTFFIFTQYLQIGLDYPAWKAGLAATPFALGGALMASLGAARSSGAGASWSRSGSPRSSSASPASGSRSGTSRGRDVALWTALPLLVAGLGGGLVISPNQTLSLSQVPVERAGSAGGVLQTGQRIGVRGRHRGHRQRLLRGRWRARAATSRPASATGS